MVKFFDFEGDEVQSILEVGTRLPQIVSYGLVNLNMGGQTSKFHLQDTRTLSPNSPRESLRHIKYFLIMKEKGPSLNDFMLQKDGQLSLQSIYHVALELLDILELIHLTGYTYNNITPESILFDRRVTQRHL